MGVEGLQGREACQAILLRSVSRLVPLEHIAVTVLANLMVRNYKVSPVWEGNQTFVMHYVAQEIKIW